jgi:predicted Zn-dependent protease
MKKSFFLVVFGIALMLQPVFLIGQGSSDFDMAFNGDEAPTPEEEYYLGRAVAANILTVYKPYTQNTELTRYLNNICQVLAINSSMPDAYNGYYVMILDSQEFNAFATPGGHIFITKGLVEAASSEDALAGIIAHELAHIMLRHGMKIIDEMKLDIELDSMAQEAAAIAGRGNDENQRMLAFRNRVSDFFDAMVKSGYSQPQEFEADDTAVTLLSEAGYDPRGLLEALGVLQNVRNIQQGGIFSTHPAPSERISNVQQRTAGLRTPDTQSARKARFNRITGRN